MKQLSTTDWEKLDRLTDEQIDTSDVPPLDDNFFSKATLRRSSDKVAVTISLDEDILDWFKAQGDEYRQRMNAALRIYVEAHRDAA